MSKLQVKIDGEYKDFCDVVDKPLVYLEQEEISKIKILADIRNYLISWRDNPAIDYSAEKWIDETALADLTEYAEKLGVEL